jgi:hypothetical protein
MITTAVIGRTLGQSLRAPEQWRDGLCGVLAGHGRDYRAIGGLIVEDASAWLWGQARAFPTGTSSGICRLELFEPGEDAR